MTATSVSVLVPLDGACPELPDTLETLERYLGSTGFAFDVRVLDSRDGAGYGARLRRGGLEAKGNVVIVVDPDLPYPVAAIGDAVALVGSGATDVVFGHREHHGEANVLLRWLLVDALPDPGVGLRAFSSRAVKLLFGEAKREDGGFDLELAYLANKYGFRVESLALAADEPRLRRTFGALGGVLAAASIRLTDRNNGYRAPRRCPVCFSSEVWSYAQIAGNIVRGCSRCKCRYLNQFAEVDLDETHPVRRVLRPHPPAGASDTDGASETAREKTARRRLSALRRQLGSGARVLEIGVRDTSFGVATAREFEYVGIDPAEPVARAARARGLEVYCAAVANFVNTGPAFDAVALDRVFETMADPHDALARIKELLKPGGTLFLTTYDTEGLIYLLTERQRLAQSFRTNVILYSRSALIELLEHSGFEIVSVGPELEYRDQKLLRHLFASQWPLVAPLAGAVMRVLPDPLLVGSGALRIVAKRRAGAPVNFRPVRSVEPTHAR